MTFISTLGQNQDQIGRLKNLQLQLGTLQTQISSGKKSTDFKGLGNDGITTQRARADFQKLDSYLQNIERADTRIKMMMSGLESVKTQANYVVDAIVNQTQQGKVELDSIRRLSENAYDFIVDTLNLQDGTAFIFAGSDTSTQPLTDNGSLDAFYTALNQEWAAGTLTVNPPNKNIAEEYMARYRNIPEVTLGLAGSLADAKSVHVRADDTVEVNYTLKANHQAFKDIISTVTAMKNISNLDVAPGATYEEQQEMFYAVFNDMAKNLTAAVDKLDLESFKLSTASVQLNDVKASHKTEKNVLMNTISNIEDVDLNEAAVRIQALGTQLEASYRVTSIIGQLSLSRYL